MTLCTKVFSATNTLQMVALLPLPRAARCLSLRGLLSPAPFPARRNRTTIQFQVWVLPKRVLHRALQMPLEELGAAGAELPA